MQRDKNADFIGVFAHCGSSAVTPRAEKIFPRRGAPQRFARSARCARRRRLHTKLSGVTVIFFLL